MVICKWLLAGLGMGLVWPTDVLAQDSFTREDRLRGSITPERAWWDLLHYHLEVEVIPDEQRLRGSNLMTFRVLEVGDRMQIDLQPRLGVTRVVHGERELRFERETNVTWIEFEKPLSQGTEERIQIFYEGIPLESKRPPWSGGLTWNTDDKDRPFIATTAQGIGASVWWPNKDHGYDEPDRGMDISLTVPEDLTAVSNGRLRETEHDAESKIKTFHWVVKNPINNYCVNMNIGHYVHFSESFEGEGGTLDVDYWVLDYHREKAEAQFKEVPRTLEAFEHWFGKYPFYEDSFKLVEVPYLGMEHQSSVTYGNGYQNGYRGRDLSDTGVGLKFDFIIVHESGHEWFGNNISMRDAADMWIHESFTNYSENLFVEYHFTKEEGHDYVIGCRKLIRNDRPIIGTYDVNRSGSGDMYYKGGNMLHTMRHIIDDDVKWRNVLRGLNKEFWHQTVTTQQVESYMSRESGIDFGKYFDQYLRTTDIPTLKYRADGKQLHYHLENVVDGFRYPVRVLVNGDVMTLRPSEETQVLETKDRIENVELDRNFYMNIESS